MNISLILLLTMVCACGKSDEKQPGSGSMPTPPPMPTAQVVAFPGAQGGGMYTTGGRGARVVYVTNLNDSGAGSLRDAVTQSGARTVLFKVSGVIQLRSPLKITSGDLTIAGQSAPGDGICLRDYPVDLQADNVIVRYMRFRMGDAAKAEGDAFGGRYHKNIIIDHCSISWSTDECASFYGNENFTMQWCMIAESLKNSVHGKGSHGYGAIWGGANATYHHNLLAHHDSRNPRFDHQALYPANVARGSVDYRNNVVYNWGNYPTYGGEGGSFNMVANYYKQGPASAVKNRQYFITTNGKYTNGDNITYPGHAKLYMSGNYYTPDQIGMNEDNRKGVLIVHDGGNEQGIALTEPLPIVVNGRKCDVATHSAEIAYMRVLDCCGASLFRDNTDTRVINDTRNGTATINDGGNGSTNGLIDTQNAVGGWDNYKSTPPLIDSDNDGMPDTWESANALNGNDATDGSTKTLDKTGVYTNLELYLNSIVKAITERQQ